MTKNEFKAFALKNNCSVSYQGTTNTMFIFGSDSKLRLILRDDFKSGQRYNHYDSPMRSSVRFGVVPQVL
jgi:hypothetical protein